jgi:hypothetical protein
MLEGEQAIAHMHQQRPSDRDDAADRKSPTTFDIVTRRASSASCPIRQPSRARCAASAVGRTYRLPEPLPQPQPDPCSGRARHLAFTVHIGFKSDLDLPAFITQINMKPISIS